jgi:hypothetical protein
MSPQTGETMKRYLALALLALSFPAHAVLTCYIEQLDMNINWTIGNKFYGAWTTPQYCYANGPELAYIQQHFTGLRMRTGMNIDGAPPLVAWFDDDADFIVNNL